MPDYLDLTMQGGEVMADCDDDSDSDGLVDAVEAAPESVQPCAPGIPDFGTGTDPLDPQSPGAGVGGIAELPVIEPDAADGEPGKLTSTIAAWAAAASGILLLAAGAWWAKRRWLR
jgi:hypothetical protein